ncbi:MAG: hypothetical protein JKY54_08720 [Flavobacteriales bacterium]|nr:hypothetical protein [Flavobacteriales bacterium]
MSAAELAIENPLKYQSKRIVKLVERGLHCVSSQTTKNTARNLYWIYRCFSEQSKQQEKLCELAELGLESSYVATRDLCFRFLTNPNVSLPKQLQNNLDTWVKRIDVSIESIVWIKGEALVNNKSIVNVSSLHHLFLVVERKDVIYAINMLDEENGSLLTPEKIVQTLRYYSSEPTQLSNKAMGQLLTCEEAVIRAEAIVTWLSVSRSEDSDLLERIFKENHPCIALSVLKASVKGWGKYTNKRKVAIGAGIKRMAKVESSALGMADSLVIFDRLPTGLGNPTPWEIFETVMPIVMSKHTIYSKVNPHRMDDVLTTAIPHVGSEVIVNICDSWMDYIDYFVANKGLPQDAILRVVDILIRATKNQPEKREGRITRLLSTDNTPLLLTFIRKLENNWEHLTTAEKDALIHIITEKRNDKIWLQAVIITGESVPNELISRIFEPDFSLDASAEKLFDRIPSDLMCASVRIYCGSPDPLEWICADHCASQIWNPVVELIARNPEHPLFDIAWSEICNPDNDELVADIIQHIGTEHADRMFDLLLKVQLRFKWDVFQNSWKMLLSSSKDGDTKLRWLAEIDPFLPSLVKDLVELQILFQSEEDFNFSITKFTGDIALFNERKKLINMNDTNVAIDADDVQKLKEIITSDSPRLYGTYDSLLKILGYFDGIPADLIKIIDEKRSTIFDELPSYSSIPKLAFDEITDWSKSH